MFRTNSARLAVIMAIYSVILSRSLWLVMVYGFVHAGIMLGIVAIDGFLLGKCLGISVSLMSLAHYLWQYALLASPSSIIKVWPNQQGEWHLQSKNGKVHVAQLRSGSFVTPILTILNFHPIRAVDLSVKQQKWFALFLKKIMNYRFNIPVILCKDNVNAKAFRYLRVYLKTTNYYETNTKL